MIPGDGVVKPPVGGQVLRCFPPFLDRVLQYTDALDTPRFFPNETHANVHILENFTPWTSEASTQSPTNPQPPAQSTRAELLLIYFVIGEPTPVANE